ncbi:MAG: glycosyl hydrolase family 18 protein [Opitutales bacterium]
MNKKIRIALIFSGLLHLFIIPTQAAPDYGLSTLDADRPIVVGYVNALRSATGQDQPLTPAQIDAEMAALHWEGYDAVVHAFLEPLADGNLDENLANFKAYQSALLNYAHQNGKSVILSIGGAYPARMADQFLELSADATKRATFVANCVNYLKSYNYDGIDIDWEFPVHNRNGRALMNQLMEDLYTAVKAEDEDYIVMFGTGPGWHMGSYDFTALKDHSDFFFYFGYDWKDATPTGANGPISAPNSGVQWTTNGDSLFEKSVRGGIQYVIDQGFPASKIICGLPFYGSKNNPWSTIRNTYNADKVTYDAAIHPDALEVQIGDEWFTTPPALKRKMDALLKSDTSVLNNQTTIRGVGTWEIGHEHSSNPDLSTAFQEWITAYAATPANPTFTIADASIAEGNSGTTLLNFTITLNPAASGAVAVSYATANSSAEAGTDYTAANGTLDFTSGQTTRTLAISISGDTDDEPNETFTLTLSNPTGGALLGAKKTATGTIENDDAAPNFSVRDARVIEGENSNNKLYFKVSLDPAPQEALSVSYATSNGTAKAGSDYTATNGTLNIAIGQTTAFIEVPVSGDTDRESNETLTLTLSNPSGDSTLANATATGTILNDDSPYTNNRNWTPPQFSGHAVTSDHDKQIIGYITQYDAWKGTINGLDAVGVLNQANVDLRKYTILNFSFFGVAVDGSMHSADYGEPDRWKNRDRDRADWNDQDPQPLLHEDLHSSWDYYILFGGLKRTHSLTQEAKDAGFELKAGASNRWVWPEKGLEGAFPIPVPDPDGAPGLFELAAEHGVKVMASIGGWSLSQHFPDLSNATKRAKFVEECQRLIQLGFDGIDLDWEFPGDFWGMNFKGSDADYETLALLVEDIRKAIGEDKELTIAFHSIPNRLEKHKWSRLLAVTDYFNLFGYDFGGGWSNKANHNAPLYTYTGQESDAQFSLSDTINYIENTLQLPLDKFNIGYPSYGRGVVTSATTATVGSPTIKTNVNIAPDGPVDTAADLESWPKNVWDGTPNYFHVKKTLAENPGEWTRHWDDEAKVPYLVKGDKFLSYDDPEAIAYKAKHYLDRGIAGTINWTVYGDLELGALQPADEGTKIRVATTVRSELVDTMNNVFAGIATPDEYTGGTLPEDNLLQQRLDALRNSRITIEVANLTIKEGHTGTTNATFTVALNRALDADFTIDYATKDQTATAGSDYTAAFGTLTIPKGNDSGEIVVIIIGDLAEEGNETFTLTLSNPSDEEATILREQATASIKDDDGSYVSKPGWKRHYTEASSGISIQFVTPSEPWATGFDGTINITNNGTAAIDSWTLTFDADSWSRAGFWSAGSWVVSDNSHAITNPTWNDYSLAVGATGTIGFTGTGTWSMPTNIRFNGQDPTVDANNVNLSDWLSEKQIGDGTRDTDADTVPGIIEFLLGTDPKSSTSLAGLKTDFRDLQVDGQTNRYFCAEIDIKRTAAKVEYRIETSDDLKTWRVGEEWMVFHSESDNPDGTTKALWRESQPNSEAHKYIRLVARQVKDE